MKTTYRIDPQGRIMIPSHIKKELGLTPGAQVAIDIEGRSVRIRKAQEVCFVCGKPVKKADDKHDMNICPACAKIIAQATEKERSK